MRLSAPGIHKKKLLDFHWFILSIIVIIIAIGLLNLRNADFYSEDSYHERQLKWYLLGMVVGVIISVIDLHIISRFAYLIYGIGVLTLIAVLFTDPVNNSRRWLPILGEVVQPSEFMKIALVLAVARMANDRRQARLMGERPTLFQLLWSALLLFGPVGLIFAEPDLGTAIILTMIGLSMILFEGVHWRTLLTTLGVIALVFPLAWKFALHPYQKARVMVWWDADALRAKVADHPELKPILDKAYQPEQAVKAIASGRFYGKGGQQGHATRQRTLPYLHTDFVIATWSEERGFLGVVLLLMLYYLLVYWALRVTKVARDHFQVLVAVGVAATIFWQFFVNVGMVTGLLPVVGVALPLLSYGGSSVITICIGMGLLFNIAFRKRTT
ncbi:MAG TPA: rod shape-determining protein RodA [Myxococcales bacterium]|nr:rod shape-determining protein RodA [Myxococcales bacterium]